MSLRERLHQLTHQGLQIEEDDGQLRVRGPKDVLTADVQGFLSEHKSQILEQLRRSSVTVAPSLEPVVPMPRAGDGTPLSFAQSRLWFLHRLDPTTSVYHISGAIELHGVVDSGALEKALEEIVRRHESLRTVFPEQDGRPSQQVVPFEPHSLPTQDLRDTDAALVEAQVARCKDEVLHAPFDLTKGPLFRVRLLLLNGRQSLLLISMHHIVADGSSVAVFARELGELYRCYCHDITPSLPELRVQYHDYTLWQQSILSDDRLQSQISYWGERLQSAPPLTTFPTDFPRPPSQSYRGTVEHFELDDELVKRLRQMGREQGTTLFMTLLAAYAALISKYSRQNDVVLGTPVANRSREELEPLIGLFANTLALRLDLSGDYTFSQLLEQTRDTLRGALENQDVPFEHLVSEIRPERDPSYNPVFQTMLVLRKEPLRLLDMGDLAVSLVDTGSTTSKFDTLLELEETADGLNGTWEYAADLYHPETVRRTITHFKTLLSRLADQPYDPIATISLATEQERQLVVESWNETETDYPADATIHQLFEEQVRKTPQSVAVTLHSIDWSYEHLNTEAEQVSQALRSHGIQPDELVGICSYRSLPLIAGLLGILKAGGAYIPLEPDYPEDRLRFMIGDTGISALLVTDELMPRIRQLLESSDLETHPTLISLDRPQITTGGGRTAAVGPMNLAYCLYTSGSTGRPKGTLVPHRGVIRLVRDTDFMDVSADQVFLQFAPISFDLSTLEIWGPLLNGGKLVLMTPGTPSLEDLGAAIRDNGITTLWLIAGMFRLMVEERIEDLGGLKQLIAGGDVLSVPHVRRMKQRHPHCRMINGYGPTENTTFTCCYDVPADNLPQKSVPIGPPIANTRVYIVDESMQAVPVGVPGELLAAGDGVAIGYLNRPELTSERFIANPLTGDVNDQVYRTGDLARWLADGTIEFLGRLDQQAKVRGFRVEPGELESVLDEHDLVREAAAIVRETPDNRRELAAYAVLHGERSAISENEIIGQIRAHLKERLPDYMVPSTITILDQFPLNANGKVDRAALPAPTGGADANQFEAPRNETEQTMCRIWSDVLGVPSIGIRDNFFEAGGDSIQSIQIVSRARQQGIDLSPRMMMRHQTVAELTTALATSGPVESQSVPVGDQNEVWTPIQTWFQQLDLPQPHHFNQAVLLELDDDLNPEIVRSALEALIHQHRSLRTCYRYHGNEWTQEVSPPAPFTGLDVVRLPGQPTADATLSQEADRTQGDLDPAAGVVVRAVFFSTDPGEPARLLIVVHHLAVDGVSWRILLEDLALACQQLRRSDTIRLPQATSTPAAWASRLSQYVRQEMTVDQQQYWRRPSALPLFPRDEDVVGRKSVGADGPVAVELESSHTQTLLRDAARVYRTSPLELLVAALLACVTRRLGTSQLYIDLEGHGREDLFSQIDLSRSVGWFTSLYPVLLESPSTKAEATITAVKGILRSVPDNGIGFGALRYLGTDAQRAAAEQIPNPPISFNYLGQSDQVLPDDSPIRLADGPTGDSTGKQNPRPHLIEINALVRHGRLCFEWVWDDRHIHKETIQQWASSYLDVLREFLDHCGNKVTCDFTPSDFPLANIDAAHLDQVLAAVHAEAVQNVLPVSATQQGILFHREADPDSDAYIMQLRLRLGGSLDETAFEEAWANVTARHSALRAGFVEDDQVHLHQVIVDSVSLPWNRLDWRGVPAAERVEKLERHCREERRAPFDLSLPPLFRLNLIQTAQQTYEFVWTCHHALIDGWSLANILDEVARSYGAIRSGRVPELAQVPGYESYLSWLQLQRADTARDYWSRELSGFSSSTQLRVEATTQQTAPKELLDLHWEIDRETTRRLDECARQHRITLNTLFQAAWSLLLRQFSGSDDVLFGTTVSGRNAELADVERMVGLFISTIPVRERLDADQRVSDWLRDLQERHLERDLHSFVPLVELSALTDLPGGAALFHHLLVFENYPIDASLRSGNIPFDVQEVSVFDQTNYPLTVAISPGKTIGIKIGYDSSVYATDTVGTIARQLEHFLTELVDHAQDRVGQIAALPADELTKVLETWNDTERDYALEGTLMDLFEAQVQRSPNAPALIFEDQRLTYAELDKASNRLASRLKSMGAGPDMLIGIAMERSIEMIVGLYGILKADAAYVPIDPDYPDERVRFMLDDSGISLLLTQERFLQRFSSDQYRCLALDTESLQDESDERPDHLVRPEHLAYMIYTSGSTGRPKGVMNSHLGICNRLSWMQEAYPLGASDRVLQKTPFSFDVSVWEFFWPLQVGSALVIAKPKGHLDSRYLARRIQEEAVTTVHFVPSMLQIFLGEPSIRECSTLKHIICSGEALPVESANLCRQLIAAELHNLYGPTEAAVDVTSWTCPTEIRRHHVPIGRPIANTSLYILDADMKPVPVGVPGELHIGGICLARGYHNQPELTASKFVAHPFSADSTARLYKTGDLTRYQPDGDIEFLGRLDHQVKIRGFRIELGEIEQVLRSQEELADCVVHMEVVAGEGELTAYYVRSEERSGPSLNADMLRNRAKRELPDYMVPSHFVELDAIPLSPNGKVDRQALPHPGTVAEANGREEPFGEVEEHVARSWMNVLGTEQVGRHDNFFDLGGHSLRLTKVHRQLEEYFGDAVPGLIEMFRLPTVHAQACEIILRRDGVSAARPSVARTTRESVRTQNRDIALIGMSCRFPGAPNVDAFWQNLRSGVESVTFFSDEELLEAGVDPALLADPRYVKANSIVQDADRFDAGFFGFTPREAELLDPQHRILLECSWESFESGGYDPLAYGGRVGVFAGCGANSYILNNLYGNQELEDVDSFQLLLASDKDYLSTRISYKLNLSGPSINVQTACSTSLVAVALACQSLTEGHCDMALAGGATLSWPQVRGYLHKEGMVFSSDGHCRAFDADSDGMVSGSGAGAVLLKPLDAAKADGDTIFAVIKGTAVNNDGANKIGFTAPSQEGQAQVIEQALAASGVQADSVAYIESHGTGTTLGDPIEIAALANAHGGRAPGTCAIGSVKTNMGHLDAAAGIAGLIKATLCLRHGEIAPNLHYNRPNPGINFASTPFYVPTELTHWPHSDQHPRRAGVSSFGIGGTNVHLILEEAPPVTGRSDTRAHLPFILSARTPEALQGVREQLARYVEANLDVDSGDLAFTLALGRHGFEERAFCTARTATELLTSLRDGKKELWSGRLAPSQSEVAFMFPGQGSQYPGMGRDLYENEPVFREQFDQCDRILTPLLGQSLRDVLFPAEVNGDHAAAALQQTRLTQPALFAVEFSLARLWMSWGVNPVAMLGHSIGEYVAACLAGVFSLEDALRIVSERARLMQQLPSGSMLAVCMDEVDLAPYLDDGLDLAVQNSPSALVVSGPEESIHQLCLRLQAKKTPNQLLRTSHAFHSRMMEPILGPFVQFLTQMDLHEPKIPFVSNLTGDWITAAQATDPSYWASHLRQTVRFSDGLSLLLNGSSYGLLEVGPGKALTGFARANPTCEANHLSLASMDSADHDAEQRSLIETLSRLWIAGVDVDWTAVFSQERRQRIPLPTYPFQRKRYWIDPPKSTGISEISQRLPITQWLSSPTWKQWRQRDDVRDLKQTRWLLFLDEEDLGKSIASRLRSAGARVATVTMGDRFQQLDATQFVAAPADPGAYENLIATLCKDDLMPTDVLHLWPLPSAESQADADAALSRSFYSLFELARALGAEAADARPRIHNVTANIFSVLGEVTENPVAATALGPLKVIPKEYPGFECRNIDLNLRQDGNVSLAHMLWQECIRNTDLSVALRGDFRWVRVFDQGSSENVAPARIQQGATYLVTGGLGGIGFILARHLAQAAGADLVLIGRTPLSDIESGPTGDDARRKLERLSELRSFGTRVEYFSADVSDLNQMKEALNAAAADSQGIRGVIHAAGVAGGGVIQKRSREECARVLDPKVKGTLVLDELFRTTTLDFLLLCSSTTAVLGEFGQVDYAAANLFLDAFASRDTTPEPAVISVNWDTWKEVGMAAETSVPAGLRQARKRGLETGISNAEGIEILERILASSQSQLVVSTRNLQSRIEAERFFTPDTIPAMRDTAQQHDRPELSSKFRPPESTTQSAIARIWEGSLGIRRVGADDDFFELGGDSLLATQVISRIRDELGVSVPMPGFFNHPTLSGLSESIDTIRWATAQDSEALPDAKDHRETFEL